METNYLNHLDSMLANAIWESIRDNQEDPAGAREKLSQLEKLHKTNPKLKYKLRLATQWITENIDLDEQNLTFLQNKLEAMGGPVKQTAPISSDYSENCNKPFELLPAEQFIDATDLTPWTRVYGEQLLGFIEQINPVDGKYRLSESSTLVDWRPLSFYENVALIRVYDPMWVNSRMVIYYLSDRGSLYRLNGTSPPIHEINHKAPIRLTEDNALDYLRFFCFFVRGNEGPFYLLESMEDPLLPSDLDATSQSVLEGTCRQAQYSGQDEDGHFLCNAIVYYSNALFESNFRVRNTGMLDMLDDNPIAGDLSSKIHAPIA